MSLSNLAQHLAAHGRGPDSMLLHVTPDEVQGLQALAKATGNKMENNPHTGLPEAGWLSAMLPTALGAGLMMIPGMQPFALPAAALIGGGTALAKKDLGAGLMAGLGAYGGAGLASGLMGAAGAAGASGLGAAGAAEAAAPAGLNGGLTAEAAADAGNGLSSMTPEAFRASELALNNSPYYATPWEKAAAGASNIMATPSLDSFGGTNSFLSKAGMAFGPALLDATTQKSITAPKQQPSYIRPFSWDPNKRDVGSLTQLPAVRADSVRYAAGGDVGIGRLLRGPGDGVSDSIPATIDGNQPAALADGEFVVPARIVSELGNGSTEAGARQLYAMLDRIQKARGGTVGKHAVAKDSKAAQHLPA